MAQKNTKELATIQVYMLLMHINFVVLDENTKLPIPGLSKCENCYEKPCLTASTSDTILALHIEGYRTNSCIPRDTNFLNVSIAFQNLRKDTPITCQ